MKDQTSDINEKFAELSRILKEQSEEIKQIKDVSVRMGLNSFAVDEVLNRMNDYENKIIPPDVLIEIFTRNHNGIGQ